MTRTRATVEGAMGAAMPWRFAIRLSSAPEELRIARRLLAAAASEAGADEDVISDLEVAVGEALANASVHAYGGRRRGRLELEVGFDGTHLEIVLHDRGKPVAAAKTVPTELPPPGVGRGLYLIGQLMDEVRLVHPDLRGRGTAVHMRKRLR